MCWNTINLKSRSECQNLGVSSNNTLVCLWLFLPPLHHNLQNLGILHFSSLSIHSPIFRNYSNATIYGLDMMVWRERKRRENTLNAYISVH
jgi:hypothetical protein